MPTEAPPGVQYEAAAPPGTRYDDPPLTVESTKDRPKLGELPWAPTVRRWSKERPGLLGEFARSLVPTTYPRAGTDAALFATQLLPPTRMAGAAGMGIRAGAAALGAGTGAKIGGSPRPGEETLKAGMETLGGEGAMTAAERLVVPRAQQMWKHGTFNPRTAARLAKEETATGRRAAEEAAADATKLHREQARENARRTNQTARDDARRTTAEGREAAEQTADVANRMRVDAKRKGVAKGMGEIIPELEAEAGELHGMATAWGKPQLDRVFDSEMAGVNARIGNAKHFKIPQFGGRPMSFDEARTALAEMGAGIGQAGRGVRSSIQNYTAADYRAARTELKAQLTAVDQRLHPLQAKYGSRDITWAGDAWDEAMQTRAAGRSWLRLAGKAMDESGRLDPDKLERLVNKNSEKLRETFGRAWDRAETILLGGRRAPVTPGRPLKPEYPEPTRPTLTRPQYPPPVHPAYPAEPAPFLFSPRARVAADILATDPMVAGPVLGATQGMGSRLWNFARGVVAP